MILAHPKIAARSCEDCHRFLYDADGKQTMKASGPGPLAPKVPVRRPLGTVPPCYSCPKIPEDSDGPRPGLAVELSDRNLFAYQHYLECRAVGQFPDDAIVRRNAAIIRGVEDGMRPDVGAKLDLLLGLLLKGR